jgi:hypothetical protein
VNALPPTAETLNVETLTEIGLRAQISRLEWNRTCDTHLVHPKHFKISVSAENDTVAAKASPEVAKVQRFRTEQETIVWIL